MSDQNQQPQEQAQEQEKSPREMLKEVSAQLQSLSATRAACATMMQNQRIRIVDETDESEDPLSITLNGQAAQGLLQPLLQAVNANREQLINQKEYLLNQLDEEAQ